MQKPGWRFRNIVTVERAVAWIAGALTGILINLLSSYVEGRGRGLVIALASGLLISALVMLFFEARPRRIRIKTELSAPIPIRTRQEALSQARHGLIGFVPLYRPIHGDPQAEGERYRRLAEALDYHSLDLENSNFAPIIKAVTTHQSNLRRCWLIATSGEHGSQAFIPALLKYLEETHSVRNVQFLYGDAYQIALDVDETLVVEKARRLVEAIFDEARQVYGLAEDEIIADITSGPRSLPLGMTLACLDEGRDLEFIATHYDDLSSPSGLTPIVFHFRTQMEEERGR